MKVTAALVSAALAGQASAHADVAGPTGREDGSVVLIEIAAHHSQFQGVFTEESMPGRCDYEEIEERSTKLWANAEQLAQLVTANVQFQPSEDTGAINFAEEKAKAHRHVSGAEPNWAEYCDHACTQARIEDHLASCVFPTELDEIGTSVDGYPIWALKIGNGTNEVGIYGNIHGDETTGGQLMQRWMYETCSSPSQDQAELASALSTWYIPMFNPDGFERNRRGNGNNQDLNRNFPQPTGGQSGVIQPETQALIDFTGRRSFKASIMFHGGAVVCNTVWDNCYGNAEYVNPGTNDRCPEALSARADEVLASSKAYCDAMDSSVRCTEGSGCQINGAAWYQITGSLQDFEYMFRDTLAMTMEISSIKRPAASNFPGYYEDRFRAPMVGFLKYAVEI